MFGRVIPYVTLCLSITARSMHHATLRRSELAALTVADLERQPDGLRVRVVRSKTDQEGRGVVIAVPDGRRLNPVAPGATHEILCRFGTGFVGYPARSLSM